MKTVQINVYKFDELSESAQRKALDNFEPFIDYIWEEAIESIKSFVDLFDVKLGREYTDFRTSHIDDDILNLSGARLMAYLWNNYGADLYKPKYLKHVKGKARYSRVQVACDCPLTGVCYDMDLLEPIIEAMHKPSKYTFEQILGFCADNIQRSIEGEIEYRHSDEAKTEDIEANEYEFTEDGERF